MCVPLKTVGDTGCTCLMQLMVRTGELDAGLHEILLKYGKSDFIKHGISACVEKIKTENEKPQQKKGNTR